MLGQSVAPGADLPVPPPARPPPRRVPPPGPSPPGPWRLAAVGVPDSDKENEWRAAPDATDLKCLRVFRTNFVEQALVGAKTRYIPNRFFVRVLLLVGLSLKGDPKTQVNARVC
jgi:hypothetical protein